MAYMNQEKKREIAQQLKSFMPKSWKYSLSVRHHSTIVMTIRKAPLDLILDDNLEYTAINEYHIKDRFNGPLLILLQQILKTLNLNNFDHSDSMSDYFHVGHYVYLNIGEWDKPFINTTEL